MNSCFQRVLAVGLLLAAQGKVAAASDRSVNGTDTAAKSQKQHVIHLGMGGQFQPKYQVQTPIS